MWPLHSDCFGHVILLDYSDKKLLKHFVVVVHFVFVIYRRLSISFDALCYMSSSMCVCVVGVVVVAKGYYAALSADDIDAAKQLVTSCVLFRLKYYNSFLMGTLLLSRCRKSKILLHTLFSEHRAIKTAHLSVGSQFLNE